MDYLAKLLFLTLSLFLVESNSAQEGWTKTEKNGNVVYDLHVFPKGNTARVTVYPDEFLSWKDRADDNAFKNWALEKAKEQQSKIDKPMGSWVVKKTSDGWLIRNHFKNSRGEKLLVEYTYNISIRTAKSYQFVSSEGVQITNEHMPIIKSMFKDARTTLGKDEEKWISEREEKKKAEKKERVDRTRKNNEIYDAIKTPPFAKITSLEAIFSHTTYATSSGLNHDTYYLFKNGTIYLNASVPFNELNVTASKKLQPDKWSTWRKSASKYQRKKKSTGEWYNVPGVKAKSGKSGERINGIYKTANASGSGTWYPTSYRGTLQLFSNGRYKSSGISLIGGHTSTSGESGTYAINGYTINLKNDNGEEITKFFYYSSSDKSSIMIGNTEYWIPKDKK